MNKVVSIFKEEGLLMVLKFHGNRVDWDYDPFEIGMPFEFSGLASTAIAIIGEDRFVRCLLDNQCNPYIKKYYTCYIENKKNLENKVFKTLSFTELKRTIVSDKKVSKNILHHSFFNMVASEQEDIYKLILNSYSQRTLNINMMLDVLFSYDQLYFDERLVKYAIESYGVGGSAGIKLLSKFNDPILEKLLWSELEKNGVTYLAIYLLTSNFTSNMKKSIRDKISQANDRDSRDNLCDGLIRAFKFIKSEFSIEVMQKSYDLSPCCLCRSEAVKYLNDSSELTKKIKKEFKYDSFHYSRDDFTYENIFRKSE